MTVEESILKKRPSSPPTDTLYFDPATGHYGEHSSPTASHELFRNHISSSRVSSSSSSSTSPPTTNTTTHLDSSLPPATANLNSSHHIKLMEDKSQSTNSNHNKLPHYPPSKPPSSLLINRKCRSQLQLNIHRMMIDSSSGSTASSTTSASGGSSQEDDDDSEELEYGPGIVAKLASKFLKYSMVSDNRNNNSGWSSRVVSRSSHHHNHKITRCSSLENVLNPVFHHRRGVTATHPVHVDDDEDDMAEDNVYDDVEDEDEDHHHLQHHHPHRRGSEGSSSSLDDHSSSSCPSGDGMTGDDFASSSSPTLSSSSPPASSATLANNSNVIKNNNIHRNNQQNNEHVGKNSQQVSLLNRPHSSIIRPAVADAIGRNGNCNNNDDDNCRFRGINLSKDKDSSLSPTITTTTTLTAKSDLTIKQIEQEVTTQPTPQLPTSTTTSPVIKNYYLKQLKKKPDASGNIFLHKYVSNCHNAIRSSPGESATLNLINRRNQNQASSVIHESQTVKGGNNVNHNKLLSPNKVLRIKPLNSSGSSSTSSSPSSQTNNNKTTGSAVVTPTYNHSLLPHNYHVGPFSSIAPIKRAKSVDSLLMECEEPIRRSVQGKEEEREQDHREHHVKKRGNTPPKRQHLHPSHPPPPPPILESRQIVQQPNANQIARIAVPRRRPLPPPPPIPVLRSSTSVSSTPSKLSQSLSTFESQQEQVTNKVSQFSSASCLEESLSTSYPVARSPPTLTVSDEKELSVPTVSSNNTSLLREQIKDHHHHTTLNTLVVDDNQDNDTFPQLTPPSYPPPALPVQDEDNIDIDKSPQREEVEKQNYPDDFFSREREVSEITRPVSEVTEGKTAASTKKVLIPQDNGTKGSSQNERVTSPPKLPLRPQRQRDRLSKPFTAKTTSETHSLSISFNKSINTSSMTDGDDSIKEVRNTLITVIDVATTSVQDHLIMDSGASNVISLKSVSDTNKSTIEKEGRGGEGVTITNEIDSHTIQSTVMESDSKSENNNLTPFKLDECKKDQVTIEEKSSISSQSSSFQRRRISGGGRACSLTRGSTLPPVKPLIAQKPKSSKASASSSSNSPEVTSATAGASVVRETLPSPSAISKTDIFNQSSHATSGSLSSTLITAESVSSLATPSPLSKTPSSSPPIISQSPQSSLESALKQSSRSSSSSSGCSPQWSSCDQRSSSLGGESPGERRAVVSASPAVDLSSSNTRESSSSSPAGNLSVTSCKDNNTSRPSSITAPPMPPPPPPASPHVIPPPVSNMVISDPTKTTATTEAPTSVSPVALSSSVSKSTTPAPPSNGVMIFDFRGKSVQPTLAIKSPYGRSAVISTEDAEEDFRGNMEVPEPCGIVFIGENEIIGSGNLLKRRNKKMSIRFAENLFTTFEYPSEIYLLNHYEDDEEGPTIKGDNNRDSKTFSQNSTSGSNVVDNSQSPPSSFPSSNGSGNNDNNNPLNRPGVGLQCNNSTAKGLGSYKPTFMASQEVSAFELGVSSSRKTSPPPPSSSSSAIPPSRSPLCMKSQLQMQTSSDVGNNPPQQNGSCPTTPLTSGSLNNNNNSYYHKSMSNQSKHSPRLKETETATGVGIVVSSNNRRMELQQQKTVGVLEKNQVNLKKQQNHCNSHVNNGHNHNHHLPVNGIKVGVGGGIVKKTSELLFPRSSTTVYSAGGVAVGDMVGSRRTDIAEDEEDSSIVDALIKPADSSQTSSWSTSSTTQADLLF